MTEEINLDLLIHPYYGFPYGDCEHYGYRTWYRGLLPLLFELRISGNRYVSAINNLYLNRFSMHSDNENYRVIFVGFDTAADIGGINDSLEENGGKILGSRFKRVSLNGFPITFPVPQIFPEILTYSRVAMAAYGEVSFLCVDAFSNSARRSLEKVGLSVNSTIINELCGDRVEGKEKLLR